MGPAHERLCNGSFSRLGGTFVTQMHLGSGFLVPLVLVHLLPHLPHIFLLWALGLFHVAPLLSSQVNNYLLLLFICVSQMHLKHMFLPSTSFLTPYKF